MHQFYWVYLSYDIKHQSFSGCLRHFKTVSSFSNSAAFLSVGQPAASSEGAAALCQAGQAEPGPVPGPARAAAPGHQHHLPGGLLRTPAGRQWERQEKDARQVGESESQNHFGNGILVNLG